MNCVTWEPGTVVGWLTVLEPKLIVGTSRQDRTKEGLLWWCVCACDRKIVRSNHQLRKGDTGKYLSMCGHCRSTYAHQRKRDRRVRK